MKCSVFSQISKVFGVEEQVLKNDSRINPLSGHSYI